MFTNLAIPIWGTIIHDNSEENVRNTLAIIRREAPSVVARLQQQSNVLEEIEFDAPIYCWKVVY